MLDPKYFQIQSKGPNHFQILALHQQYLQLYLLLFQIPLPFLLLNSAQIYALFPDTANFVLQYCPLGHVVRPILTQQVDDNGALTGRSLPLRQGKEWNAREKVRHTTAISTDRRSRTFKKFDNILYRFQGGNRNKLSWLANSICQIACSCRS